MKVVIGLLLLVVIMVAVNAMLGTNKPKLSVLQGGISGIGPGAGKAAGL